MGKGKERKELREMVRAHACMHACAREGKMDGKKVSLRWDSQGTGGLPRADRDEHWKNAE